MESRGRIYLIDIVILYICIQVRTVIYVIAIQALLLLLRGDGKFFHKGCEKILQRSLHQGRF